MLKQVKAGSSWDLLLVLRTGEAEKPVIDSTTKVESDVESTDVTHYVRRENG